MSPLEQPLSSSPKGPESPRVSAVLATLPPLTNVERQAFREQFTRAQCEEAGMIGEPRWVLEQALSWLTPIGRTLLRRPLLVRRYGRARFAWLLECTRDLGEAIQIRQGDGHAGEGPHGRKERVQRAALRIREELIECMLVLTTGDDDERRRLLEAAGGDVDDEGLLASSLHALARLAEDWMDHEGPVTRALVTSVDLTRADVESARAAAHALLDAHRGREGHDDLKSVGRTEGRVMLELGVVKRFFERARRWDPRVPALTCAPELRAALSG